MVTKVVTDKDVDGVTIIINGDNKLACATPSGSGSTAIEIEELSYKEFLDSNEIIRPFMSKLWVDNKEYPINKVGRIKGTNWLVFQAEGLLQTKTTPPVTEPEQPPVTNKVWTADVICEQNQDNPVYDETFTGVRLGGDLPEGITTVQITKANGQIQSFIYSGTDYKYNIDPNNVNSNKEYPMKVTLVTAQGNVSKDVYFACMFLSSPE